MTYHKVILGVALAVLASNAGPLAQIVPGQISGGDGSDGAISVTTGGCVAPAALACTSPDSTNFTMTLPPDGVIQPTTFEVGTGVTLRFVRNALNTPAEILATGQVTIEGTIDVSGEDGTAASGAAGGPGGFAGGSPDTTGQKGGPGFGPGAGPYQGPASYAGLGSIAGRSGSTYGSPLLIPIVGGSGGGGSDDSGGGGGGGGILIASDVAVTVGGQILATGGWTVSNEFGPGSGGAIRLVAPLVNGSGSLAVSGGKSSSQSYTAGTGRIRIDAIAIEQSANLTLTSSATTGQFLQAKLETRPQLDVLSVGAEDPNNPDDDNDFPVLIPEGSQGPVEVFFPFGAPTTQPVTIQAKGFDSFTSTVCVDVVAAPSYGDLSTGGVKTSCNECPVTLDVSGGGAVSTEVTIVLPLNKLVRINAWSVPCP